METQQRYVSTRDVDPVAVPSDEAQGTATRHRQPGEARDSCPQRPGSLVEDGCLTRGRTRGGAPTCRTLRYRATPNPVEDKKTKRLHSLPAFDMNDEAAPRSRSRDEEAPRLSQEQIICLLRLEERERNRDRQHSTHSSDRPMDSMPRLPPAPLTQPQAPSPDHSGNDNPKA